MNEEKKLQTEAPVTPPPKNLDPQTTELNDEMLEKVAGGMMVMQVIPKP